MIGNKSIKMIVLRNIPIILFIAIFLIFGIFSPKFISMDSFKNILVSSSYVGIIAIGIMFVLLTGGIDLSIGSVMYLSAAVTGLAVQKLQVPTVLAIIIGLGMAVLVGVINAFLIVILDILPFITTLGMMVFVKAVGLLMTKSESVKLPKVITSMGSQSVLGIPMPIIIFAIIILFGVLFLGKTKLGRQIYAVGNDVEEARKAGIHTKKVLFTCYVMSALFAGIGGIISVAQIGIVNAAFGKGEEFNAIAAAVLGGVSLAGGVGKIFPGVVLGAVMIQMIQAGLVFMQIDLYKQPLISAGIIFLAVFLDSIRSKYIAKAEKRNIRNENKGLQ
ncbi:ABC transporter permease [Faecalicatena contorta]|uniref:Monosaccharide ABC transporter membrane protein, CUT2 family n=1 Tax=Faecalicatena contorta TaxID=39482 RepID=A0A315ZVG7_9FIRM|nr:ABC transporter permease [Faecalicatena contorta]PWJ49193.1 monosaccharide ABC transporter membrane protein (CUT2 family) [Faecalicatena contorta]SUQ14898.1 monosaccharide ABC transporter membrane protein, CUT2 family [Faecalicatena contorta]